MFRDEFDRQPANGHGLDHWLRAVVGIVICMAVTGPAIADQPIPLHGAIQFADEHPFNRTLLKFEELTKSTTESR